MIELKELFNGNLLIYVPKGSKTIFKQKVKHLFNKQLSYGAIWSELFEDVNLTDYTVSIGDDIGHMTSSPIITLDMIWNDNCRDYKCSKEWWYPDYMVHDPLYDGLMKNYEVTFILHYKCK